jgi:hypothetical protein
MPDATVQALWAAVLSSFYNAARLCKGGAEAKDSALLDQGAEQIREADRRLDELTQRVRDLR